MKHFPFYSLLSFAFVFATNSKAQQSPQLVDQVAAVIGNKIILQSDVEKQYAEYVAENLVTKDTRCMVLEDLMFQKLLLAEAEKDTTMVISDAQVDQEEAEEVHGEAISCPCRMLRDQLSA